MNIIRLPLEGAMNVRDLGGYVGNNRVFKWKKVLRSDCMSRLTMSDKDFLLKRYNLKKAIDLRTAQEVQKASNVFAIDEDVKYVNIPLSDDVDPNKPFDLSNIPENFLKDLYIDIIENRQSNIKNVINEILELDDNASVIFHCTAGKDRTGVVAMLLLGICGVAKQDITTNYMQTATNLKYNKYFYDGLKQMAEKFSKDSMDEIIKRMIGSEAEYIEYTYDRLIEKYGSFHDYFIILGFTNDEICKLINSLTEELV